MGKHLKSILAVVKKIMESSIIASGAIQLGLSDEAVLPLWKETYYSVAMMERLLLRFPELYFEQNMEVWLPSCTTTISNCRCMYFVFFYLDLAMWGAGLVQWWGLSHWVARSWVWSSLYTFARARLVLVYPFLKPHLPCLPFISILPCESLWHRVCPLDLAMSFMLLYLMPQLLKRKAIVNRHASLYCFDNVVKQSYSLSPAFFCCHVFLPI